MHLNESAQDISCYAGESDMHFCIVIDVLCVGCIWILWHFTNLHYELNWQSP